MAKKTKALPRLALTDEELKALRSDDLIRLKLSPDEKLRLKKINENRAITRRNRIDRMVSEQKPIVEELRAGGVAVELLGDCLIDKNNSETVAAILLGHLSLPYSDVTKETIARGLARCGDRVTGGWEKITTEYKNSCEGLGIQAPGDTEPMMLGAKSGLAAAITCYVSDQNLMEVIDLLKDPLNGRSRIILLTALFESKNPLAEQALLELSSDPVLKNEISHFKNRRKP